MAAVSYEEFANGVAKGSDPRPYDQYGAVEGCMCGACYQARRAGGLPYAPRTATEVAATQEALNSRGLGCGYDLRSYREMEKALRLQERVAELMSQPLPRCECGAEKVKSPGHSDWCPKYVVVA